MLSLLDWSRDPPNRSKLSTNYPTLTSAHSLSQTLSIEAGDPGYLIESNAKLKHPRDLLSGVLEEKAIATFY